MNAARSPRSAESVVSGSGLLDLVSGLTGSAPDEPDPGPKGSAAGSGSSNFGLVDPFAESGSSSGPGYFNSGNYSSGSGSGEYLKSKTFFLEMPDVCTCLTGLVAPMCEVSCDGVCAASSIATEGPNTQSCRCDSHCFFFQDCCKEVEPASSDCADLAVETYIIDTDLSLWSCHSIYPATLNLAQYSPQQAGVYAVSMCPSTWYAQSQQLGLPVRKLRLISDLCETAHSTLPLVSDASSGRVYKNEYCAFCHKVSRMSMWRETVLCSSVILDSIRAEHQLSLAVVREQCGPCIYSSPPTLYSDQTRDVSESPRSCTPAVSSCPEYSQQMKPDWATSAEDYQEIVKNCTKHTAYVQTFYPVVYKNPYCAACNLLVESPVLQCFDFDLLRFPFCKSNSYSNGSEVEVVLDTALKTAEVFGLSDGNSVPLDVECPPGQVFSFPTFNCRAVSCSQFDVPNSNFTCSIAGVSTGGGGDGSDNTSVCSNELVLDDPLLLLPIDETTYYYYPLFAVVFVSYTNALGFPVACLDSAVPTSLPILQALNILTFLITIPSMIILACVSFVYLIPSSMRSIFGLVVSNFAFACFLADFALLLGYSGAFLSRNNGLCFSAGVLDHAFALCQFYWLIIHTFDVGLRYYQRAKSIPPSFTLRVLVAYYGAGWCLPFVITSFEVAFIHAIPSGGMGSLVSCFQISSFYIAIFLYLVPGAGALVSSLVSYPVFLCLLKKVSFKPTRKDKTRFVILGVLLFIMTISFVVQVICSHIPSIYADIIVGFLRLVVVAVRSTYLGVVLLCKEKVPKAVHSTFVCTHNKVASATAEEVELALYQCEANTCVGSAQAQWNFELNQLAAQLANPSLHVYKE